MSESEIVTGLNEWLRQYAENPEAFSDLVEDVRKVKAGEPLTYGDECYAILQRMVAASRVVA